MQPHAKRNSHESCPSEQLGAVQSLVGKGQAVAHPADDLAGLFPQSALRRPNEAQSRAPPEGVTPGGSKSKRKFQKKPIDGLSNYHAKESAMNAKKLVGICALALLVVGWGITPAVLEAQEAEATGAAQGAADAPASGESVTPQTVGARHLVAGDLGGSSTALDAWSIHCPSGTHHLHFDLKDFSSGGPTLGIICDDFATGFATYRRAPSGGISTPAQINGGSGIYVCYVFKTGGCLTCSAHYDTVQNCHNSGHGLLNHTQHFIFQNQ